MRAIVQHRQLLHKTIYWQSAGAKDDGKGATSLPRVAAEALDALARLLQCCRRRGVGDAEEGAHGEGGAVHTGDPLLLEQCKREILVRLELGAFRRGPADNAGARRINVERTLGLRA